MSERNADIWSTRLQRELLALTTDEEGKDKDVVGVLPPFITLRNHELDIVKGICTVSFQIDVPAPKKTSPMESAEAPAETAEAVRSESAETPSDTAEGSVEKDAAPEGDASNTPSVLLVLDASLATKSDGTVETSAPAYPFLKPNAILKQGAHLFPEGSTIEDGDFVDIDCDWTPSLHLNDAVLNVGLKVKESILQREPFHAAEAPAADPVDDIVQGARKIGSFLSKSAKGLVSPEGSLDMRRRRKKKAGKKPVQTASDVNIGDEINLLEEPWVNAMGVYSCKAIRRPKFVEEAMAHGVAAHEGTEVSGFFDENEDDGEVPDDLSNYMRLQAGSIGKVAGAGLSGAGSMFRSFTRSAKSVLEESSLMITPTHIIELKSSKLNLSTGTVAFAASIDMLAKLKFRRQESISLFFKVAPDDPLVFMCPDSLDAVHQIQSVLKRHGVKGKHTNASTQRAINDALRIVQEIQKKERALESVPTVERVNEIMDLYRQAAERFEVAGDIRHEEVMSHMRKFLALPLTVSILDGSYEKKVTDEPAATIVTVPPKKVPEGEVLERSNHQLEEDDMSTDGNDQKGNDDSAFNENMDNILKEAKEDLDNLNLSEDDGLNDLLKVDDDEGDSTIADLDAMLNAADKELADIMNS